IADNGTSEHELLQVAASVEAHSEHPLSRAIVEAAKKEQIVLREVAAFQSTTGGGVSGNVDGRPVLVGKEKFLADSGITFSNELRRQADRLQEQAQTTVWIAVNGHAVGLLGTAV